MPNASVLLERFKRSFAQLPAQYQRDLWGHLFVWVWRLPYDEKPKHEKPTILDIYQSRGLKVPVPKWRLKPQKPKPEPKPTIRDIYRKRGLKPPQPKGAGLWRTEERDNQAREVLGLWRELSSYSQYHAVLDLAERIPCADKEYTRHISVQEFYQWCPHPGAEKRRAPSPKLRRRRAKWRRLGEPNSRSQNSTRRTSAKAARSQSKK